MKVLMKIGTMPLELFLTRKRKELIPGENVMIRRLNQSQWFQVRVDEVARWEDGKKTVRHYFCSY